MVVPSENCKAICLLEKHGSTCSGFLLGTLSPTMPACCLDEFISNSRTYAYNLGNESA